METLIYLFKTGIIYSVLYLIYFAFFRNNTHFQINRAYLLLIIPLAFCLPIINSNVAINPQFQILLPVMELTGIKASKVNTFTSGINFFALIYFLICTFFLLRFILKLYRINKTISLLKSGETVKLLPFSFFSFIYIPNTIEIENREAILLHEKAHASQGHSFDILLYEIALIILWWNPFMWRGLKSVKTNHEFIADKLASEKASEYSSVLVAQLLGVNCSELANNFNYKPLIKKRIKMMKTKKSNNLSVLKYALVIPVITISIVATSNSNPINNKRPVEAIQTGDKVYTEVDQMPEFKGGTEKLMTYLGANVKYPEEASLNKTEGTVYIQFVVDKKGNIKDVTVIKSADLQLDAEAKRVVESMPDWNPGVHEDKKVDVQMVLPIRFQL